MTALDGTPLNVTKEIVAEEATFYTKKKPVNCRHGKKGVDLKTGLATWVVSFLEEGIEGNELADRLANAGAKGLGGLPTGLASEPSLSGVRSIITKIQRNITAHWYSTAKAKLKPRYLRWKLDYKLEETPELRLPRQLLARFLAMRHGHGDFRGYHEWREHEPSNYLPDCACGGSKSTDHLVHCPITKSKRAAWPDADTPDEKYLLEVLSDPKKFKKFVEVTDFFAASSAPRT